jgi:hypothetical protein
MPKKTQISLAPKKCRYVGDIASFGNQILLPINSRIIKNSSFVVGLPYVYFPDGQFGVSGAPIKIPVIALLESIQE